MEVLRPVGIDLRPASGRVPNDVTFFPNYVTLNKMPTLPNLTLYARFN